ncbi:rifin [Plasmodium falciparum NF54]|uniref:Rifin n=2 Tax=Plasmodium falciparum TaxID=5833 RepID=O96113_PLAF7|nr:rifin [Plasmodium falciparum 3D7]EWC90917.1 hypothetical protein PFNF54_00161 [Plasmodium falciparum NF54]KAF4331312.1 rifin [Plasmodium falciparum NF54]PKC46376.1 rifin [Plasmodium falciparum NF54]CZT98018.1 rifin [Plasmodium falciparum 3D7]|eukprot:XP_001349520.2 rifin [Plasmodium falciparum 3D7]
MKLYYSKILLFSLILNILVPSSYAHNKNKQYISARTPTITSRMLSECDINTSIYDDDTEMKFVKENFDRQTSQRFEEYNERLLENKQKCKEKCDKEIQKIILKDKLEKELMDKFATLQTDIQNDAIPTCVCEKSLADKTEKFCLNCGVQLGGGVLQASGLLGGIGAVAVNAWKDAALEAAIDFATEAGAAAGVAAGEAAGKAVVIKSLKYFRVDVFFPKIFNSIGNAIPYYDAKTIGAAIAEKHAQNCALVSTNEGAMCYPFEVNLGIREAITFTQTGPPAKYAIPDTVSEIVEGAEQAAKAAAKAAEKGVTAAIKAKETRLLEAGFNSSISSINASIIAIVVIILIMVIIYLILRYRRKKRMKKKHQYIKLLEE